MRAANPSEALGKVLVDELARAGVSHACLAPGSRSAPLAMALAGDRRIRDHVMLDERSAAFLAVGIARGSGRPVALLSTSGTAAANFHPAVIEAHQAGVPLVVLTADRPPELRDRGANQTIDQIKLYADSVRWFCEVGVPEARPESVSYWRSIASRAVAEAAGSPRGPVHLNVAFREPLVPEGDGFPFDLDGRPDGKPWTETSRAEPLASEADVGRLAEEARRTERGLIVVGAGSDDLEGVAELAHAAGWPVLADPSSGLRGARNAISTYEALLRHEAFGRAHRPDVVIRIGKHSISRAVAAFFTSEVRQVLIDPDARWLDPERALSSLIVAEPGVVCREVSKALSRREDSAWLSAWLDADGRARRAVDAFLDSSDEPSEPRAARDLPAALPDGSTLVVAASMPVRDLDWFMAPRRGLSVVGNRGTNGIDGFVSTALGVALARPSHTCALAGDLSMIHDQNGLMLPRTEPVDCVFVVLNNDGGGIFSFLPQAAFPEQFEKLFGTPHGLDFEKLADLHDCGYALVQRASELPRLVARGLDAGGVHIVEVRTDRRANVELHRRLWDEVARALG